jgi:putative solute:sodium symporter small subunit
LGVTLALIGWGATLATHGMAGRALRKQDRATAQYWRAVFYLLLALTLAATMPLVVDLLNLATVAGFPVGFYVAAQGLLIVMAILAFRAATHLDALSSAIASAQPREDH